MTNSDHICKFGFSESCNQHWFFVVLNYNTGNPTHIGHPKPIKGINISMPSWLLSEEKKEDIWNDKESSGNNFWGRNFVRGKFGKFINTMMVGHLNRRRDCGLGDKKDDIASMPDKFQRSKEIQFTTLSNIPVSLLQVNNRDTSIQNSDANQNSDARKYKPQQTVNISTTKNQIVNQLIHL